ncbi:MULTISPECIES: YycC family protein [unclassified Paenibacillus]|uniref:YycC family protein n=1 Tax=Paenibacillus provencensis TaxID=441151 RepID=A0ABW3Q5X3_9BACL|nr:MULTISPECIES: YycC family protein [unclassified Paenibacillus]MCM3129770.1 YycC family protein [Paenibacillus sp. MER 78]SFS92185.1 YycC-like protein [Paenibacillus sp. 453mf]
MRPLQISADTAVTLSKKLGIPIEQLMHMPQHILMQKLAELSKEDIKQEQNQAESPDDNEKDSTS